MTELELLKRKLERERIARKQAESILESKALELYDANESLKKLNDSLEEKILNRTKALQESEHKYRNVIDQASDIIYTCGNISDYYEFPIRAKSGSIHWIGQNVNRIEQEDGRFIYNAVARDISLRKQAESDLEKARLALTQSEYKYRTVLENMDLGLMEVDKNGVITRVYNQFCKLTGYTEDELIGKNAMSTFIVPEFKDILKKQDLNRLNKQPGVYEIQIQRKDGKHIWVLISGTPFYNENGEVIGSLGVHYDISDRKDLENNLKVAQQKAVKAQKAEQLFLANMSHEIRTPLNAIIGMSHLIGDTNLDIKQREYIDILSNSADILKGLVSDILDISKIDSGIIEKTESEFMLSDLISRLVQTFKHRANEKGIKLISINETEDNLIVSSDRQWLNQILINLLSNAIKFTNDGKIKIIVKNISDHDDFKTIYFEVSDTGIGINDNEVKYVFNSFIQANNTVRKNYGGTGLGLYISSKLVSLLGGELEVESKEGEGSKFYFTLNINSGYKTNNSFHAIDENIIQSFNILKILVVEDNIMNQKYILSLLDKWEIKYSIANDGQQAVEKVKQNNYDLVFMDLSMPVMDGYEATKIIRSLDKIKIPIIALTASTFLSKRQLALQSGMTDFLAKPFVPEDLYQMILKYSQSKLPEKGDSSININEKTLKDLYGNDVQYKLEMFELYIETIDNELDLLMSYLKFDRRNELSKQAHKMKPIFSMVGLNEISDLVEELEKGMLNKNITELKNKCDFVKSQIVISMPKVKEEILRLKNIINK